MSTDLGILTVGWSSIIGCHWPVGPNITPWLFKSLVLVNVAMVQHHIDSFCRLSQRFKDNTHTHPHMRALGPVAKDHAKASKLYESFPNDLHFRYVLSASYQELLTLVNGMRAASRAVTSALMLLGQEMPRGGCSKPCGRGESFRFRMFWTCLIAAVNGWILQYK